MKLFNPTKAELLSQVMSEPWFIHPQKGKAFFVEVLKNLKASQDGEKESTLNPASTFQFISESGQPIPYDEDPQPNSVAMINIWGPMMKYSSWYYWGTLDIANMIRYALSHKNVIGVVLNIDTGGGSVGSIAPLEEVISNATKPIVALCDTAASAGYWAASLCDMILASNSISSSFGSIGVMVSWADFTKYYEEFGIKLHEVYAPESNFKNKAFREANDGNYKALEEETLSPLAIKFQNQVKNSRGKNLNLSVEGIINGKMFFAEEALKVGLVDRIGGLTEAIKQVRTRSELSKINY